MPGGMYWQLPDALTSTLVWNVASKRSSALRGGKKEGRRFQSGRRQLGPSERKSTASLNKSKETTKWNLRRKSHSCRFIVDFNDELMNGISICLVAHRGYSAFTLVYFWNIPLLNWNYKESVCSWIFDVVLGISKLLLHYICFVLSYFCATKEKVWSDWATLFKIIQICMVPFTVT